MRTPAFIDHLELTFVADRPQPCSPHGFHEGRLHVFLSRSPCRRPLRPVLKETSLRLHECGRGERGIFLGFDDQEGAGVYHLSAGARGFFVRICFSGSIVAFFGVIDIAERPEVYYPCGQAGRFIGRSRNLSRRGKRKYLSFQAQTKSTGILQLGKYFIKDDTRRHRDSTRPGGNVPAEEPHLHPPAQRLKPRTRRDAMSFPVGIFNVRCFVGKLIWAAQTCILGKTIFKR